jgi:hypothetical protein
MAMGGGQDATRYFSSEDAFVLYLFKGAEMPFANERLIASGAKVPFPPDLT